MGSNYQNIYNKDYEQLYNKTEKQAKELSNLKYEYNLLEKKNETLKKQKEELIIHAERQQGQLDELQREVDRLKGLMNIDGTNSGLPTSHTPINKKKVIPNSRNKTERKVGGQKGHKKSKLERFEEEEININISHEMGNCSACGSEDLEVVGEIEKDELDYRIVVEKKRHKFVVYHCNNCGKEIHKPIPCSLKEENQYGPQVQALELSLMNQGNVPINKVKKIVGGLTRGEISPSESYCVKLEQRAANDLSGFCDELRRKILYQNIVYWDDTVIAVDTQRACLRYYGNEKLSLYKAHHHKDKDGLDEDKVLSLLSRDTTVVHDHNKVNYNAEYSYQDAECNAHLLRDLKKVSDNLDHEWSKELSKLLTETNDDRNKLLEEGANQFTEEYQEKLDQSFDDIMLKAFQENKADKNKYYQHDEETLITRILDYKNQYIAWVYDFDLPFTNNLSERSLRGIKTKMKVSGQFKNIRSARNYAAVKSYIETCNRNGVNEFDALTTLCIGRPLSLAQILANSENSSSSQNYI